MRVIFTRDIPSDVQDKLIAELNEIGTVDEHFTIYHKALGGGPSYIQIIADAIEWITPYKAAAVVFLGRFLSELAKRSADDLYDKKGSILEALRETAAAPLKKLNDTLYDAIQNAPGSPALVIGLPLPEPNFGTAMVYEGTDQEDLALAMARFIAKADEIEVFMKGEIARGRAPLGRAQIVIEPSGDIVITWTDQGNMESHEHRITGTR